MRSILAFILILVLLAIACGSADDEPPTLASTAPPAAEQPTTAPPTVDVPVSAPDPSVPAGDQATVINIVDGDTIDVELDGEEFRVRYIGIDTPERGDDFYKEASDANASLVLDQTVILVKDVSETDRFGRLLRYIYLLDGTFVNAELMRQGLAEAVLFPPDDAHYEVFLVLQGEAQASDRGKWSGFVLPPTATPLPAAAGGQIIITTVDKAAEFVDLGNTSDLAIDLAGWVLISEQGNQTCDLAGVIEPGAVLRVWARTADADQGGFNCGFGRSIWNNSDPDPAVLYDPAGSLVDRYP